MFNRNQYFLTTMTLFMAHLIGCSAMNQAAANVYVPIFKSDDNSVITSSFSNISLELSQDLNISTKPIVPQTDSEHSPHPQQSFIIGELTQNLELKLKSFRNTELGIPFIQQIFDTMDFVTVHRNDSQLVGEMASRLTLKISRATRIINDTRRFLRKNLITSRHEDVYLHTVVHPCRPFDELTALDQHYDKRQIEIKNWPASAGSIDQFATLDPANANYTANRKLVDAIRAVNYSLANLRQVYFLSRDDWAGETTCRRSADDVHLR